MAWLSELTFFSCCLIMSLTRSCSSCWRLSEISVKTPVWSKMRLEPLLENNGAGTFAEVFFQDTDRLFSLNASCLDVGNKLLFRSVLKSS